MHFSSKARVSFEAGITIQGHICVLINLVWYRKVVLENLIFPFTVDRDFIHNFVYKLLFSIRENVEIDKSSYSYDISVMHSDNL